jgi:fatty acid synthase
MYLPHTIILLQPKVKSGEHSMTINLQDESMEYLSGHVIDGRNLFPATGYLVSFVDFILLIYVLFA